MVDSSSDGDVIGGKHVDLNELESRRTSGSVMKDVALHFEGSVHSDKRKPLPNLVDRKEQLLDLPDYVLSGDKRRPLLSRDAAGNPYHHALKPMFYSVIFILLIEALERFSYYGIVFTQTSYLTGYYNITYITPSGTTGNWDSGFGTSQALQYTSSSTAIAYTAPFVGALLSDGILGEYHTIWIFTIFVYIPGLLLVALTAKPLLLGDTFNKAALTAGMLVMYPVGTGCIKSVVNVMGARQFHPVLHATKIEQYYVYFYMCINIGALIGGIIVPLVCTTGDVFAAYMIPASCLTLGIIIFLSGTPRYVRMKPAGSSNAKTLWALLSSLFCYAKNERVAIAKDGDFTADVMRHGSLSDIDEPKIVKVPVKQLDIGCGYLERPSLKKLRQSRGGKFKDMFIDNIIKLWHVVLVTALVVPFNIGYAQMTTTFIAQGQAMQPAGRIDAALMNNMDAVGVLVAGFLVSTFLYPFLARRNIQIKTAHKFAIGSCCGCMAIISAIIVNQMIKKRWRDEGKMINVFWQTFQYMLIGTGEIFAISTSYEAAYVVSARELKTFSSATNVFMVGGLPNYICTGLVAVCSSWFVDASGNTEIENTQQYTETKTTYYLIVLCCISFIGVIINFTPWISNWLHRIETNARRLPSARGKTVADAEEFGAMGDNLPGAAFAYEETVHANANELAGKPRNASFYSSEAVREP